MTVIFRGSRIQCLNVDSLPTTGVSVNQMAEICDTNVWKCWNGSSWATMGTNTWQPIGEIPGDVNGSLNSTINPAAGGTSVNIPPPNWGHSNEQFEVLPFYAVNSLGLWPNGRYVGQLLYLTDKASTKSWTGQQWQ